MQLRPFLVALVAAAVPAVARAQVCTASPCEATMTATGTIASSVTWSQVQALSFGSMVGPTVIGLTAPTSGRMRIDHNQPVTVTVAFPASLSNSANTVPVSAPTCGSGTTPAPTTPATFNCTAGGLLPAAGAVTQYVYVGATATPGAGLPAGVYTGTITFRATYTAF